jgi:hypothetical protein
VKDRGAAWRATDTITPGRIAATIDNDLAHAAARTHAT